MPHLRPVFSSHVGALGYDDATRELHVRWRTGRTTVYHGVPADVAEQVQHAPSIGTALHELVRGRFRHEDQGK